MSTIDSEEASKLRIRILNVANKFVEAYTLSKEGKLSEARAIIYDIERFEINSIYTQILELEFEQTREEKE